MKLFPDEIRITDTLTASVALYLRQAQLSYYARNAPPLEEGCATADNPVIWREGEASYMLSAYCWEENRYTQHHQHDYPSGRSERTCNCCGLEYEFARVTHSHRPDKSKLYAALANMGLDSCTRDFIRERCSVHGSGD